MEKGLLGLRGYNRSNPRNDAEDWRMEMPGLRIQAHG
jgi:hypothetical protein